MDSINQLLTVTAIFNLALALLLVIKGRKVKGGLAYASVVFLIVFWTVTMIFFRAASSYEFSLRAARILYFSAAVLSYAFLIFTFKFSERRLSHTVRAGLLVAVVSMALLTLIGPFTVRSVFIPPSGEKILSWGPFYLLYVAYVSLFLTWGIAHLFLGSRHLMGPRKSQVRLVFFGYLFSASLAMVTNLFLPSFGYFELNWLGQILTVFYVSLTVYAILRYRFLDLRLVLRKSLVYAASLVVVVNIFTGLLMLWWDDIPLSSTWKNILLVALVILFWELSRRVLKRFIHALWPVKDFSLVEFFAKVKKDVRDQTELQKHLPVFAREMALRFKAEFCLISLRLSGINQAFDADVSITTWPENFYLTEEQHDILWRDFVGSRPAVFDDDSLFRESAFYKKKKASSVAVMKEDDVLTGFLVLGPRIAPWSEKEKTDFQVLRGQFQTTLSWIIMHDRAVSGLRKLVGSVKNSS